MLSFLNAGTAVLAEFVPPGEVNLKTEHYLPTIKNFETGVYKYDVAWQGIPVAESQILVRKENAGSNAFYDVAAECTTGSAISLFFRMHHVSESVFDANSFRPKSFNIREKKNSTFKSRVVNFKSSGSIHSKRWKNDKLEEELDFNPNNDVFDPIAGAFMARSLSIKEGEEKSFDVFNGKHRYLITFKIEARETIEVNERNYDTYRIRPTVRKLTDTEGEKKLKSATIWITADFRREIVKIESSVWIGSVTVELAGYEPEPATTYQVRPTSFAPESKILHGRSL